MSTRRVQLVGSFSGFSGETILKLTNGEAWQQAAYLYHYHYAYMPEALIHDQGGRTTITVSGVPHAVPVRRVSIVLDGVIVSDFDGFSHGKNFQFEDGSVWQQTDATYSYHYAYRPSAMIVDGLNGTVIAVEDVDETVPVRRIR